MATSVNAKVGFDPPVWRGLNPPSLNGQAVITSQGMDCVWDGRNDPSRDPWVWFFSNTSLTKGTSKLVRYNPIYDTWDNLAGQDTLLVLGTVTQLIRNGSSPVHCSSRGPRGTVSTGCTTTSIVLSTALPATVAAMQLANKGDGTGFKIRIIGNAGGSSGKTEERFIVANTSGTTPTLTLDSALSFTPASGDAYEILSGRILALNATASNNRFMDIATGFVTTPSSTNAPAITTDSSAVWLDECYVPAGMTPGQGFMGNLVATATAAGTITGQATGGDAGVAANRFRNRQIRIVQDTGTPTAVGQRRKITSHTAGASPVYTLASNWTVTPSATATFVIEYPNELVVVQGGSTAMYSYAIDANGALTADTWSTGIWAVRPNAGGAGMQLVASYGLTPDAGANVHEGLIYYWRGGSWALDVLDIGGAATGSWTTLLAPDHLRASSTVDGVVPGNGARIAYDFATLGGRYLHMIICQTSDTSTMATRFIARFDLYTRQWLGQVGVPAFGTINATTPIWYSLFIDGATAISRVGMVGVQNGSNSNLPVFNICMDLLF